MDEHAMPHSTNMGTLDGKLLFVEGAYSEMKVEGADASGEDGVNIDFALYDPNAGTFTKLDGSLPKGIDMLHAKISSCGNMLYIYAPQNTDDPRPEIDGYGALLRCTYDSAAKSIRTENLTAGLKKALGGTLISAYDTASYGDKTHRHFTIAAVPDGVAIIGSATAGEDTHIIYNGSTEPVAFERTSSYHGAFFPLAAYDNGTLYAMGCNSAEQGSVYFRSTHVHQPASEGTVIKQPSCTDAGQVLFTCKDCSESYARPTAKLGHDWGAWKELDGEQHQRTCAHDPRHVETAAHSWGDGEVTKEATVSAEGVRTFTCADCGAAKTEAIPVVQPEEGETYETAGVAYKVTSAAGGTVTFVKAKNAKKVIVPATVKMGGKTYKVTAIASGAFAKANKVKSVVIGKNVKKVGKKAFKGAKKLKTLIVKSKKLKKKSVKGSLKGSKVKTVKVKVGKKKANKKYAKKYKKIFTKKNCGKKVKVKA